jgi:hypothetical protein
LSAILQLFTLCIILFPYGENVSLLEFYSMFATNDNGLESMDNNVTSAVPLDTFAIFCISFTDDEDTSSVIVTHNVRA